MSKKFSAADAEVKFQSSDGVIFQIHLLNLKASTSGFPPTEILPAHDEIVPLTETASTLELLFPFIYPARYPDLGSIDFETLEPLAEAAEKYQVYPAMSPCNTSMKDSLPYHAEAVLAYAIKHDYPQIISLATPLMLKQPLEEMVEKLPSHLVIPWIKYHNMWTKVACKALSFYALDPSDPKVMSHFSALYYPKSDANYMPPIKCKGCGASLERRIINVMKRLGAGACALQALDSTFSSGLSVCCEGGKDMFHAWRESVEADIERIPDFITFV